MWKLRKIEIEETLVRGGIDPKSKVGRLIIKAERKINTALNDRDARGRSPQWVYVAHADRYYELLEEIQELDLDAWRNFCKADGRYKGFGEHSSGPSCSGAFDDSIC